MKTKLILLFLVVLLCVVPVFAGTTYNQTVSYTIVPGGVIYHGTIDMTDDTTGVFYTQAFLISFQDRTNYAYLDIVCSDISGETEDVNAWLFYSNDEVPTVANGFVGATDKDLDAISTTLVADTATIQEGDPKFKSAMWCSLKIDGQTGNPHTTVTCHLFVPIKEEYWNILQSWRNRLVTNLPAS